jgi:DNA-binding LytR/AlgR family response regulator
MVEKFRRKFSKGNITEGLADLLTQIHKPEKLRFNQKGKTIFIDPDEIIYCMADGNYTKIFIDDTRTEVVSTHLKQVVDLLTGDFQRLGRSLIINRKYLSKIDRSRQLLEFRKLNQDFVLQVSPALIHKV